MSYLGNSPGVASQRVVTNRVANEGQIRISADSGYVKGYVDVIINGTDMVAGVDFTEVGDGINVDMAVPLNSGDTIKLVSWIPRGLTDGYLKSEADDLATRTLGLSNFRNRIINGDMKVAQRGTSFAAAASGTFPVDRFTYTYSSTSAITLTQNTDVPTGSGLSNSLRATVTTADTSIASGDNSILSHLIEGYNVADLVGNTFTLSFWVRSSKTGIHCVRFRNGIFNISYVSEYNIITANTWEKKTITVLNGIPSTGTWDFTNGTGLVIGWSLAMGSSLQAPSTNAWLSANYLGTANQVNCLDTVGNIFAITGVQLEKGSTATAFEFRPYSVELAMCQRYYWKATSPDPVVAGYTTSGARIYLQLHNPVPMRAAPSITFGTFVNSNCGNMEVNFTGIYYSLLMASITTTGSGFSQVALQLSAEL